MSEHDVSGSGPEKPDYEVGYQRPPKSTQFKPGQSGNPKGRKRKPKSVQEQVQKVLSQKVSVQDGGKTKSLPLQEVILRKVATNAAKGDLKAASFLINLLRSPEFAETDVISETDLSADDQALLDSMIERLSPETGAKLHNEQTDAPVHEDETAKAPSTKVWSPDTEERDQ